MKIKQKSILRCVGVIFLIGVVGYMGSAASSGCSVFLRMPVFVLGLAIILAILCRKCS